MSLIHQAPKKSDGLAVALLAVPFLALQAVTGQIVAVFNRKSSHHSTAAALAAPDVTPNQQYEIADRVCIAEVRGQKISLRQYFAANVIRITCRDLRHLKPIEFTPAIADDAALMYDLDGAIQWVRKNGLESDAAKRAASKPNRPEKGAAKAQALVEEPAAAKPATAPASPNSRIVPATGNKSAPFTGRIVSFGITKRTVAKKTFSTYAMKLRSESGTYEKEFLGEHLSDLVTDLDLKEGQLVRLRLLGKHYFEVEVDGEMEERNRNHYEIVTL